MEEEVLVEKNERKLFFINKMTVRCVQDAIDDNEFEIKEFDLLGKRILIDKIEVVIPIGYKYYIKCGDDFDKKYFLDWKYDVGGIFTKDLRESNYDKYYQIETGGSRTIVRKVDEEIDNEIVLKFKSERLLKIGDYLYLPIKTIDKNSTYDLKNYSLNGTIDDDIEEEENQEEEFSEFDEYEKEKYDDITSYYIPEEGN